MALSCPQIHTGECSEVRGPQTGIVSLQTRAKCKNTLYSCGNVHSLVWQPNLARKPKTPGRAHTRLSPLSRLRPLLSALPRAMVFSMDRDAPPPSTRPCATRPTACRRRDRLRRGPPGGCTTVGTRRSCRSCSTECVGAVLAATVHDPYSIMCTTTFALLELHVPRNARI